MTVLTPMLTTVLTPILMTVQTPMLMIVLTPILMTVQTPILMTQGVLKVVPALSGGSGCAEATQTEAAGHRQTEETTRRKSQQI